MDPLAPGHFKVRVTSAIDPLKFNAHIGTEDILDKIGAFEKSLQDPCNQYKGEPPDIDQIQVNDLVLAKCEDTGMWCRAVVSNVYSESVDVLFVDYWNTELVPIENIIVEVPDYVRNFPKFIWECTLTSVKPIASSWIKRATDFFCEQVLHKTHTADVVMTRNNMLVLDVYIEIDDETVKTLSDMLVDEGLGRACQDAPADPGGSSAIGGFNMQLLMKERQESRDDAPISPESAEVNIEQEIFSRGLDRQSSVNYEYSDTQVGMKYMPHLGHNPLESIQDMIEQMNTAITHPPEVDDHMIGPVPALRGVSPLALDGRSASPASRLGRGRGRGRSADRRLSPAGVMMGREGSPHEMVGKGRTNTPPRMRKQQDPQFEPPHPLREPKKAIHPSREPYKPPHMSREPYKPPHSREPQKPPYPTREPHKPTLSDQEKEKNEIEWRSYQFTRKIDKLLKEMTHENYENTSDEIKMLVFPAHSIFKDFTDCPRELHLCLDFTVSYTVENLDEFYTFGERLLKEFEACEEFLNSMSEILWKYHDKYVTVQHSKRSEQLAENFCKTLALFYKADWNDNSWITCPILGMIDRWAVFDKRNTHKTSDQQLLYVICLHSLLEGMGSELENFLPNEMNRTMGDIREKVLSNTQSTEIRSKFLDILLLQNQGWRGAKSTTFDSSTQTEEVKRPKLTRSSSQTVEVDMVTAGCQTDHVVFEERREVEEDRVSELASDDRDPYRYVRTMLHRLSLLHLWELFEDNAIRDSVLDCEFSDLKELLKECGLKAGQILEIKNYLKNREKSDPQNSHRLSGSSPDVVPLTQGPTLVSPHDFTVLSQPLLDNIIYTAPKSESPVPIDTTSRNSDRPYGSSTGNVNYNNSHTSQNIEYTLDSSSQNMNYTQTADTRIADYTQTADTRNVDYTQSTDAIRYVKKSDTPRGSPHHSRMAAGFTRPMEDMTKHKYDKHTIVDDTKPGDRFSNEQKSRNEREQTPNAGYDREESKHSDYDQEQRRSSNQEQHRSSNQETRRSSDQETRRSSNDRGETYTYDEDTCAKLCESYSNSKAVSYAAKVDKKNDAQAKPSSQPKSGMVTLRKSSSLDSDAKNDSGSTQRKQYNYGVISNWLNDVPELGQGDIKKSVTKSKDKNTKKSSESISVWRKPGVAASVIPTPSQHITQVRALPDEEFPPLGASISPSNKPPPPNNQPSALNNEPMLTSNQSIPPELLMTDSSADSDEESSSYSRITKPARSYPKLVKSSDVAASAEAAFGQQAQCTYCGSQRHRIYNCPQKTGSIIQ